MNPIDNSSKATTATSSGVDAGGNVPAPSPWPVIGFAAYSGTGKTTLLAALIRIFAERGLQVGVVKHAHHTFDIDQPGKDSYTLRAAGASSVVIGSRNRIAVIDELRDHEPEPSLTDLLARLPERRYDLVLVEGFKRFPYPKIELRRNGLNNPTFYPEDTSVIAVASDYPVELSPPIRNLDLNDPPGIADFIYEEILTRAHHTESA